MNPYDLGVSLALEKIAVSGLSGALLGIGTGGLLGAALGDRENLFRNVGLGALAGGAGGGIGGKLLGGRLAEKNMEKMLQGIKDISSKYPRRVGQPSLDPRVRDVVEDLMRGVRGEV